MNTSPRDDASVDRVLAQGRPSGPELDAVWSRLSTSLDEAAVAAAPAWWTRPWAWASGIGVAAAAAVLIAVSPGSEQDDAFSVRGSVGSVARLEASCGAIDAPCQVGEEVALRIHSRETWARADVYIKDRGERRALHRGLAFAGASTAVPVLVVPDSSDVAAGIDVEVVLDGAGEARGHSIHLHVVSP